MNELHRKKGNKNKEREEIRGGGEIITSKN